jgi:calpain-7
VGYNPELAAKHDDGIFWISWQDVLLYFQNIQLSWNPTLFPFRVTTHSFWPKDQGPVIDTFNVGDNPQYIMVLSKEAAEKKPTIWILISRHVTKQEQEGCEVSYYTFRVASVFATVVLIQSQYPQVNDFLTIHLVRSSAKKERIWHPHGPNTLTNGAYTNNPHVLVRYDVSGRDDQYISVVLSQHKKSQDMAYTLSCYCTEPFSMGRPQKELPYLMDLSGSWSSATACGPVGKDNFFKNPMYVLNLAEDATLQVRCSAAKTFAG